MRWGTTREVLVLRSSIVFFCFTLFQLRKSCLSTWPGNPCSSKGAVERDHIMPNPPVPLHTEVKRHRARLVVRWGTTREVLVLRSSIVFFVSLCSNCASHVCLHGLVTLVHPRAQSSAIISCRISLLHTEVKRHRARLVRWGTTREVLVLRSSIVFLFHFVPTAQVMSVYMALTLVHPRAQSSAIISCRIHPFLCTRKLNGIERG